MEETLQHEEAAQCIGLSPSGTRNHRSDGPKAGQALTFMVDLSKGADQPGTLLLGSNILELYYFITIF